MWTLLCDYRIPSGHYQITQAKELFLLVMIDSDANPSSASLETTGPLAWGKHDATASSCLAFHNGQTVGRIFERSNHTNADKEVYLI
ncbi:hypothetical protein [Pseudooceanicola spongiae]|uniref:Uncharacterized protein n=1 Tax=Pseudooceanicola spongiae TaxID=2613965 RepID=A0A7L9WS09_9RHOB|nr:hypothetical protein [Pseudooceanicola spongiae]QOL82662.1 hypothetical protein F3W81_18655 [Pseudooceanicola spongiae]